MKNIIALIVAAVAGLTLTATASAPAGADHDAEHTVIVQREMIADLTAERDRYLRAYRYQGRRTEHLQDRLDATRSAYWVLRQRAVRGATPLLVPTAIPD